MDYYFFQQKVIVLYCICLYIYFVVASFEELLADLKINHEAS